MSISVTANFPGGNANLIECVEADGLTEIRFAPDPHGGPEALWFRFRVRDEAPAPGGRRLRLVLRHYTNLLGGDDPSRASPVYRPAGGDWTRLGRGRKRVCADGQVEGLWEIDLAAPAAEFALCFPYDTEEFDRLDDGAPGYWRRDRIGLSQQGRPLVRLSNGYGAGTDADKRPGLYAIARQHAGETSGSWVLHGFLETFAREAVDDILVWCVPLANLDGVEQGDYGKDNFPYDLNRAWGQPPMRHETLVIQRDMLRWRGRCLSRAALDFHAPGLDEFSGIYAFMPPAQDGARGRIEELADVCGRGFGHFADARFARTATYASRWETPNFTRFCLEALGLPALSIETPYAFIGERQMERKDYREAGGRLARELIRFLRQPAGSASERQART